MAFSPISFLLGIGIAYALPAISRSFRPLAVEATAIGLGLLEDARRMAAEQLENLEDIAAEARARREHLVAAAAAGDEEPDDASEERHEEAPETSVNGRGRRRGARTRTRTS